MKRLLTFLCILLAVATTCRTAGAAGLDDAARDPTRNTCRIAFDDDPLPNCFAERNNQIYIALEYRAKLDFGKDSLSPIAARYGLAAVMLDDGFAYANRGGRVVIKRIAEFDNGPADFQYGVVRVYSGNKMNFATVAGKHLFPVDYDWVTRFERGRAYGCIGCRKICDRPVADWGNCEDIDISYVGGSWFRLAPDGKATSIPPARWYPWMRDPGPEKSPTFDHPQQPKSPPSGVN
jgi:hypothetical protein